MFSKQVIHNYGAPDSDDIVTCLAPSVSAPISHVYGTSNKPLNYCTVASLMERRLKQDIELPAVISYEEGISKNYRELNDDINQLANGLIGKLNLKVGDFVGIYSYNNYQNLLINYACNKLGLVLNAFNPSFKYHEFSRVLQLSNVKVLFMPGTNSKQSHLNDHSSVICNQEMGKLQNEGKIHSLEAIVLLDGQLDHTKMSMKDIQIHNWDSILSSNKKLEPETQRCIDSVSPENPVYIYYTSGTTGSPKGVVLSQFSITNNVIFANYRLFKERGPKFKSLRPNICIPLPVYHVFAGIVGLPNVYIDEGTIVLTGIRYNIRAVVESIIEFDCNVVFVTPTILIDLLNYVEQNEIYKLPLRLILIGGSPVMSELIKRCHNLLKDLEEIKVAYGSSENGCIATTQSSLEIDNMSQNTVGTPIDLCEVRIASLDTGATVALGQTGEILTRGHNQTIGYINDPEKTRLIFTESRWYKTGDLGMIDDKGSLRVIGRIKDLIIKGGENIYPAEIETVLHEHPYVDDGHAFGVPDKRFGEEVCAWIKVKEDSRKKGEAELRSNILSYLREKLTYFKVPKYILFVDEFPTTSVLKVKKFEMRAQTMEILGLPK